MSRRMSRHELAEAAGVGSTTVARLENDSCGTAPTYNTQLCLAMALGYDVEDLWPSEGSPPSEQLLRFVEAVNPAEILSVGGSPFSWLRIARLSRGMTREQLAEASGLSMSAVHKLEWGKASPRRTTQMCLAMTLRYPVEDLWPNDDRGPSQELRDFARELASRRILGRQDEQGHQAEDASPLVM
jgi:transcriptional regulator with XRE-family HTH domain